MTDTDIFRTAIDLIAAAPTGQGNIRIGGVPAYNERYGDYARRSLALLREYLEHGEIAFGALPESQFGVSDRRWGPNIRINQRFRDRTAVVAVLLLHEGCHLLRDVRLSNKVEQEVICRTLGVCLYRDLIPGIRLTESIPDSRGDVPPRGTRTIRYRLETREFSLPAQDAPIELSIQNQRVQSNRLVDWVISHGYAGHLTAEWIQRSIGWWGGLRNREPGTKGHYLRCLALAGAAYAGLILRVLESIGGPTCREDWDAMTRGAAQLGGIEDADLQRALSTLRPDPAAAARIRALEQRFPVDLGFGRAAATRR